MKSNPYESHSQTVGEKRPKLRVVITTLATIALVVLGYIWIVGITEPSWIKAAFSFISLVTVLPWIFHNSHARDAASASISIFVGACSAILATILYFQLFNVDWFRETFNDKGTGPFGLLTFFGVGFTLGWFFSCRVLIMMSFPTEDFLRSSNKKIPQDAMDQ